MEKTKQTFDSVVEKIMPKTGVEVATEETITQDAQPEVVTSAEDNSFKDISSLEIGRATSELSHITISYAVFCLKKKISQSTKLQAIHHILLP